MSGKNAQKRGRGQAKSSEPPRKRGNQGDFKGRRLQHLDGAYDTYKTASEAGKVGDWFTNTFFPDWFQRFPWYTVLMLDPIQTGAIGDSVGRDDGRANVMRASTATEAQRWTPTNTPGSGVPGRVQGRGYEEENEGDE